MLTKSVLDTLQEAAGLATFTAAVPGRDIAAAKAANANSFDHNASLVRPNLRLRRAQRYDIRSLGGWAVRMW